MKKEVKNYIFIGLGTVVIILLIIFHFLETINYLLYDYNLHIDYSNRNFNTSYSKKEVFFFGEGYEDITFLVDLVLIFIVILVIVMIFLKVFWSVRNEK